MATVKLPDKPKTQELGSGDHVVLIQNGAIRLLPADKLGRGGAYGFAINDQGHLILTYQGDEPPNYSINDQGHLILTVGEDQTIDLGVVKGKDGANGKNGADGAAAGFGSITATVDGTSGTPAVTVQASGPDTAKVLAFAFTGLKGADGTNGTNGKDGADGADGAPGANGASAFMPLTETAEVAVSITANSAVRITGQPTALSVSLGAPAAGQDNEWRLVFKAGEGFALTDTAPEGHVLRWEAEPVWQAGTVYEVSYGSTGLPDADGNTIIGVLWRAWT